MGGGASTVQKELEEATSRATERVGKPAVSGRYHRLPRRIEDDYLLDNKVLGTGYNGSVTLATGKQTGLKYAVKGFHLHGVKKEKLEELETEAEIFLSMDHPHVARLTAVFETPKELNLVMECMEGGEVYERVARLRRFSEKDASHTLYQMLLAVNYIHSKSIVHRDLKLENFLYEKKDGDHLKLIDFGFSKVWEKNTKMDLSCGTLAYVAPEVLKKSYTSQCDMWSMGCIAFILLFGYMPFGNTPEAQQQRDIKAGKYIKREEKWSKVSKIAQNFVESLLVVDTNVRLSAEKALEHDFIKSLEAKRGTADDMGGTDANIAEALVGFAEASNFRRACMSVMAWSLTNEERAKVRDAFLRIDTNRTGTITLKELKDVLVKEFDVEDEKSQQIFAALDTAQNDEIHYSEFLAAMVSTRIAMHDGLLKATFEKFDVDATGFISLDNLKEVLGDSFDGEEVNRLVAEADRDKDGQISYNEFITFLKDGGGSEQHNEAAGKIIDNAHHDAALMKDAGMVQQGGLKAKHHPKEAAPPAGKTPASPQKEQPAQAKRAGEGSKACMIL